MVSRPCHPPPPDDVGPGKPLGAQRRQCLVLTACVGCRPRPRVQPPNPRALRGRYRDWVRRRGRLASPRFHRRSLPPEGLHHRHFHETLSAPERPRPHAGSLALQACGVHGPGLLTSVPPQGVWLWPGSVTAAGRPRQKSQRVHLPVDHGACWAGVLDVSLAWAGRDVDFATETRRRPPIPSVRSA